VMLQRVRVGEIYRMRLVRVFCDIREMQSEGLA
jgi:hypothetical protein